MSDITPTPITEDAVYRCAVNVIKNLKFLLNGAPLDVLTPDEIHEWEIAMKVINAHKEKIQSANNQKTR